MIYEVKWGKISAYIYPDNYHRIVRMYKKVNINAVAEIEFNTFNNSDTNNTRSEKCYKTVLYTIDDLFLPLFPT